MVMVKMRMRGKRSCSRLACGGNPFVAGPGTAYIYTEDRQGLRHQFPPRRSLKMKLVSRRKRGRHCSFGLDFSDINDNIWLG